MSDCNRCLWATRNGSCASWDCRFVDQREAYEAYNRGKADANKWIPCSERLPEKNDEVLVTGKVDNALYVDIDEWTGAGFWINANGVIAWMPLPEPYKEEEDGCVHQ